MAHDVIITGSYETILNEAGEPVPSEPVEILVSNEIPVILSTDVEGVGMGEQYALEETFFVDCSKINEVTKSKGKTAKSKVKNINTPGSHIDLWLHDISNKNCMKFYKAQGSVSSSYPQLESENYFLLIMTNNQIELLKRFSNKLVCIDWQKCQKFEFVTLLVLDDSDLCFPCAFLFTNKSDTGIMEVFFYEIKSAVGAVHTKLFMSGRDDFIADLWDHIMVPADKRFYCSWDILSDWKTTMSMMGNKKKIQTTFKSLKTLLEVTDVNLFTGIFEQVLFDLKSDPETSGFAIYLTDNYLENKITWACCFLSNEGIKVNFQLEKMHSTFKQILKAKSTSRIDKFLDAILSFLRSKIFDRLVLMCEGKVSSKLSEIRARHKFAEKFKYKITNNGDYWTVVSAKKEQNKVKIYNSECPCHLKCYVCNVCAHYYTCTCFDSTVKLNMCRHIHSVCINEKSGNVITASSNDSDEEEIQIKNVEEHFLDFDVYNVDQEIVIDDQEVLFEEIIDSSELLNKEEIEKVEDNKNYDSTTIHTNKNNIIMLSDQKKKIITAKTRNTVLTPSLNEHHATEFLIQVGNTNVSQNEIVLVTKPSESSKKRVYDIVNYDNPDFHEYQSFKKKSKTKQTY